MYLLGLVVIAHAVFLVIGLIMLIDGFVTQHTWKGKLAMIAVGLIIIWLDASSAYSILHALKR